MCACCMQQRVVAPAAEHMAPPRWGFEACSLQGGPARSEHAGAAPLMATHLTVWMGFSLPPEQGMY